MTEEENKKLNKSIGGRPKKSAEEKRTHEIKLRLNKFEFEEMKSLFIESGQKQFAAFLTKIILATKNNHQIVFVSDLPEVSMNTYKLLCSVSNNQNQITKGLNVLNGFKMKNNVVVDVEKVNKNQQHIHKILQRIEVEFFPK